MGKKPTGAVVIAGGELNTIPQAASTDLIIAADSGYDHAVALGVSVDILVGDFDSISAAGLADARRSDVEIVQLARNKDETDLDIAVRIAIDRGAEPISIYGGEGGRIAHLLAIALATSKPMWLSGNVTWHTDTGVVQAATPDFPVTLECQVGDVVTLVPVGEARGVTTKGLRWALESALLEQGTSLGVSNESISEHARIDVGEGAVLVIQEGPLPQ